MSANELTMGLNELRHLHYAKKLVQTHCYTGAHYLTEVA